MTFVDVAPAGRDGRTEPQILKTHAIRRLTAEFPTRASNPVKVALRKAVTGAGRFRFAATGVISEGLFGERTQGLTRVLMALPADLYIAHNIETLLPTARAARRHGAALAFDCMEYYSDMGDDQSPLHARAARQLEACLLPSCALVLASSESLADVLSIEYGIRRPLPAHNVPASVTELPQRRGGGLNLYWRNSVIGFGQRGLEDALEAMARLPPDVRLFLQGRRPADGGRVLAERISALRLGDRVIILPPHAPEEAVHQAALHDVGLCLERPGPRNHDLTVSNKMFDYHMAALAVISSDLPSLSQVIARSRGGLLYKAGDPASLARAIWRLRSSPGLLRDLQTNARSFAMREANLEQEIGKIASALKAAQRPSVPAVAVAVA